MSAYKVYGDPVSGNCLKVKWTLDYLGADYEWIETSILKGETRRPEFLAINPAGQAPVIVTKMGRPLAQSNAIILFLAENHGGELLPPTPYERAKVYEWLFWEQYDHEPYIAVRRFQKTYLGKADAQIDPKLMERGVAALTYMENRLAGARWIAAEGFSAADISLVAYTRFSHEGGFDLNAFPNVKTWVARVEQRLGIGAL
ncbi:MAG: glutathione S-transferase family protein [Parvularculaceae bacterium]|nr:glutathione S-transferase family protein [Parvularculaceae bacterium]